MRDIWDIEHHDNERARDSFDGSKPPYQIYQSAEVAEQGWIQGREQNGVGAGSG